ncbi:hypothetical protein PY793_04820 [Acetobacter fabarum]|uniref:hypothetical protein n=1 Tax=Acetobacter fabarum TaxID=483199 RepID=UPI00312B751D
MPSIFLPHGHMAADVTIPVHDLPNRQDLLAYKTGVTVGAGYGLGRGQHVSSAGT